MLDLAQLQSFTHVAERGTVVAAARALGYTPPAVSQHIAKLEDELGTSLFDRAGGRLHLTVAGHALLPVAHQIADLADTARSVTEHPVDRPHYCVAAFASAITGILIPRLASLRREMSIDIVEAEDASALRELALGAVDLVLIQEYDDVPIERDKRFTYTSIVADQMQLVMHSGLSSSTRTADLGESNWLINGDATRCAQVTRNLLAARGLSPRVAATVGDNATLLSLVEAGHGVTIVPALVLEHVTANVVVSKEDLGIRRTVFAATRTSTHAAVEPLLQGLAEAPTLI